MKNTTYILLFLSISCLAFTCSGDEDCESYQFELPVSVTPVDTISLGDTIWIESHFTRELLNLINNKMVTMDTSYKFGAKFAIDKISTNPFEDACRKFDMFVRKGKLEWVGFSNTSLYKIDYHETPQAIELSFCIKPTERGNYAIGLWYSPISDHHDYFCKNIYNRTKLFYAVNNKADNNYDIFMSSPDTTLRKTTKEIYDKYGSYTFVVK